MSGGLEAAAECHDLFQRSKPCVLVMYFIKKIVMQANLPLIYAQISTLVVLNIFPSGPVLLAEYSRTSAAGCRVIT